MNVCLTTEILPTHTAALFRSAVDRAAELLCAGEVVALPTETVYGLAANALKTEAVEQIYEIKGRPQHNPIIIHVAGLEMAKRCVKNWPPIADKLAKAFWPGPLTLVLPRAEVIPDIVTAGGDTVGVRWPSHPITQAVIRQCGFPLAAPSANLSNRVSPTNAEHVRGQLHGKISLIIDGGQSQVGIESTVIDLTVSPPRVLRPGMIHEESLEAVIGRVECHSGKGESQTVRSPGLLRKHYSPKAKLVLLQWQNAAGLEAQIAGNISEIPLSQVHVIAHSCIPSGENLASVSVIPHDPEAFARALYAELHRCDEGGAQLIVVEKPPESVEWRAITDRLKRAAAS